MKKIISFILLGSIVLSTLIFATGCGNRSYSLESITQVKSIGADGYGSLEIMLNTSSIAEDVLHNKNISNPSQVLEELTKKTTYSYENEGSLKNGDKVKVFAKVDPSVLDKLKMSIKPLEFTYTVSGLKECEVLDAFKDVEIVYEGISPDLYFSINTDKCSQVIRDNVFFDSDSFNVHKGDTITIKASYDKDSLLEKGYVLKEETKNYEVKDVSEYVSTIKGVDTQKTDSILKSAAELEVSEYYLYSDNWTYDTDLSSYWNALSDTTIKHEMIPVMSYYSSNKKQISENSYTVIFKAIDSIKFNKKYNDIPAGKVVTGSAYFAVTTENTYVKDNALSSYAIDQNKEIDVYDYSIDEFKDLESAKNAFSKNSDYIVETYSKE